MGGSGAGRRLACSKPNPEATAWSLVRFERAGWTALLHADGWEMNGCPVNGPGMAAAGERVAVAWFTAPACCPTANALVSWLEQGPAGTDLHVRQLGEGGPRGPALRVADSSSARSSAFPRLELAGGEPVLAWHDAQEPARVRTAVLVPGAR